MNDQTFHTPSFGDEEFDIPTMHMQQHGGHPPQRPQYAHPQHPSAPQMGMINPAQDGLSLSGQPSYQQPLYLQPQDHPVHSTYGGNSGAAPAGNYLIQQQPGGQQRLLMMQPASMMPPQQQAQHGQHPQQFGRSPQRASPPGTTTSEDSDDSAPPHHATVMGPGGQNSLKRPSPEPAEAQGMLRQLSKKPKVQKKKKKRDPNEPQKPVSAYALFFRDTQAAIKGQNPNASFGEVSKIVASMWDGLDTEHKSVYKQKTETAKKEYLKALAAYRASLVSKQGGNEQEGGAMYGSGNAPQNTTSGNQYNTYYSPSGAGQGYSPQGHAPPGQSPPPHHMGPPHAPHPAHHHIMQHSYMHHAQVNPANQLQPINSPHRSPQHHSLMGAPQQPQSLSPQLQQLGPKAQGAPLSSQNISSHSAQQPISAQALQIPGPMGPQAHPISNQNQMMSPNHHQQAQNLQNIQSQQQQTNNGVGNLQSQNNMQGQQLSPQQQHNQQQHAQQPHVQQQQHAQQQQQQQQQQHAQQQPQQAQHVQNQQQNHQQNQMHNQSQGPTAVSNNQSPPLSSSSSSSNGGTASQGGNSGPQACIRHGCTNPAVSNSEWEDEYCSNECVVSHCRDVFTSWVASNNNQSQNFSTVK